MEATQAANQVQRRASMIAVVAMVVTVCMFGVFAYSNTASTTMSLAEEDAHYKSAFHAFKQRYSREYDTDEENSMRFQYFKQNVKEAQLRQSKVTRTNVVYGVTKFSDWSPQEFKERLLTHGNVKLPGQLDSSTDARRKALTATTFDATTDTCTTCTRYAEFQSYTMDDLPTSFDWRDYGAVTSVKNQAECGSCWSFATTGDVEGSYYLAGNNLTSLSEQQLVTCDTYVNAGCNGGLVEYAFEYVERVGGLVAESVYPYQMIDMYTDTQTDSMCDSSVVNSADYVASIDSWSYVSLDASTEAQMALALMKAGPLAIALNADGMQYYVSGVDDPSDCSADELDHAVLLVGWGVEDDVDYWIIKNSWADEWGEDGYYRVVKGENMCGLATDVVTSFPTAA